MRRKDLGQVVASAVVAIMGAAVGVALMAVSGKKIDEQKAKENKVNK